MNQLTDVDIYVGTTDAIMNFASNGYSLCGSTADVSVDETRYTVSCNTSVPGQYVVLQRQGSGSLTLCEVYVRTKNSG